HRHATSPSSGSPNLLDPPPRNNQPTNQGNALTLARGDAARRTPRSPLFRTQPYAILRPRPGKRNEMPADPKPRPRFMQIGEVADRTGLTQRPLRYYEEKGLLRPPSRMEGGFRLYTEDDLERIEQVKKLQKLLGFSLAEIKHM